MNQQAPVFEKIYSQYLHEISSLDKLRLANRLGVVHEENSVPLQLFGFQYRVSDKGITDWNGRRPKHGISVILAKYLLHCPAEEPRESDWVTYRNIKDASPLAKCSFSEATS